MKKKDIEVIVSKELLNIVGHHLEICITVKNEDNKTAPTAYGDMVEFMRGDYHGERVCRPIPHGRSLSRHPQLLAAFH